MVKRIVATASVGLLAALFAGPAQAQDDPNGPNAPDLYTIYGTSVNVGGGLMTFADDAMRDFADIGAVWEARGVFGTRARVAVEAAYTGGAASIDALGLDSDAALISTGLEALARVNLIPKSEIQPYLGAGIGWRRYDITNADFNTSSVNNADDLLEVPMAAGLAYRYRGLVVDARAMLHLAFDEDLVRETAGPGDTTTDLHTWSGNVSVGMEF